MDFEEYSKTKEGLIELGKEIKDDIAITIDYWLSIREQITVHVINWSFMLADKVVRDLKDAELEARILAIENKSSETDVLSILLGIFIPSIIGRGIGSWFRLVLINKNGRGAKILEVVDKYLRKVTGGKEGTPAEQMIFGGRNVFSQDAIEATGDLTSKQIIQDGGKGAVSALYNAIRQERDVNIQVKSKQKELVRNSSLLSGNKSKNDVSPARGFLKTIQNTLLATNVEWKNLATHFRENELDSPFYIGTQYSDFELLESKDSQKETERAKLRAQQIQYLFSTLSFLKDQQQLFYSLIYHNPKPALRGKVIKFIPRTSEYYQAIRKAEARGGIIEDSILQELGYEFKGDPNEVWVIGEKIEPLPRRKREELTNWYEDLYIGLLLATYFEMSDEQLFVHIDGETVIPLQKKKYRETHDAKDPMKNAFVDSEGDKQSPSKGYFSGTYLLYLRKMTASTLVKVANILVYQEDEVVGEIAIQRGQKVIEVASSPMANVSKEPPRPGVDIPGFWGPENLPKDASLETLRFFIDLALLQFAETLKTSSSIVKKAEEELGAAIK